MMDQSEVFIWIHDWVELVGRGVVLANHSSGDKREDNDSCEMLLTGHEPITAQVTNEMTMTPRRWYSLVTSQSQLKWVDKWEGGVTHQSWTNH